MPEGRPPHDPGALAVPDLVREVRLSTRDQQAGEPRAGPGHRFGEPRCEPVQVETRQIIGAGNIRPARFAPGTGNIRPARFAPGTGNIRPARFAPGTGNIRPARFAPGAGNIRPARFAPGAGHQKTTTLTVSATHAGLAPPSSSIVTRAITE
ncbi:hypothetical protein GCM10023147_07190 [Tsukamurella soli]|uniref:Uncharacterized protein n=1 Tax=Tsukamurella soli TaxID=644556 RepID=A0ABP8J5H1_9ACTN